MTNSARIAMRVHPDIKAEAEKAAAVLGSKSLSEFIIQAAMEKAKKVLEEHQRITLNNADFDGFFAACEKDSQPSDKLKSLGQKVEQQGYQ